MPFGTPPASVDYSTGIADTSSHSAYGNLTTGDCEIAGAYHILGVLTALNGAPYVASDAQCAIEYATLPYINRTVGVIKTWDVMDYYINTGFADKSKIIGVIEIDPENITAMKTAVWQFQNAYISMPIPGTWPPIAVFGPNGFVWDVTYTARDEGGNPYTADSGSATTAHVMGIVGYTSAGLLITSYGWVGVLTWAAIARYCPTASLNGGHVNEGPVGDAAYHAQQGGGLWVWLCQDHICNGNSTDTMGRTWPQLMADFQEFASLYPLPVQYTGAAHAGQRTVRQVQVRGRNWRRGRRAESF